MLCHIACNSIENGSVRHRFEPGNAGFDEVIKESCVVTALCPDPITKRGCRTDCPGLPDIPECTMEEVLESLERLTSQKKLKIMKGYYAIPTLDRAGFMRFIYEG